MQPQRELNQSWIVRLRTHHAERCHPQRSTWVSELHPVGEVEDFSTKLQTDAFGYSRVFEKGEIPVRDPLGADVRIRAAFAAERKSQRLREAARIEPLAKLLLSRTRLARITPGGHIRP